METLIPMICYKSGGHIKCFLLTFVSYVAVVVKVGQSILAWSSVLEYVVEAFFDNGNSGSA